MTQRDKTWKHRTRQAHNRSKHTASLSRTGQDKPGCHKTGLGHSRPLRILMCLFALIADYGLCHLQLTQLNKPSQCPRFSTSLDTNTKFTNNCVGDSCATAGKTTTVWERELAVLHSQFSVYQCLFFSGVCVLQSEFLLLSCFACWCACLSASSGGHTWVPQLHGNCRETQASSVSDRWQHRWV